MKRHQCPCKCAIHKNNTFSSNFEINFVFVAFLFVFVTVPSWVTIEVYHSIHFPHHSRHILWVEQARGRVMKWYCGNGNGDNNALFRRWTVFLCMSISRWHFHPRAFLIKIEMEWKMNSNLFLFLISLFFARPRLGLNYEAVLRVVVLLERNFQPDEQFEVGKAIGWSEYSPGDQENSQKRSAFILPTTFATKPVLTGQPHLKYTALAVMEKKFDWKILTRLDSRLRSPCKRATVVRQQRNQQPVQWLPSYNKFLKGKYSKEKKTEKNKLNEIQWNIPIGSCDPIKSFDNFEIEFTSTKTGAFCLQFKSNRDLQNHLIIN